LYAYVNNTPLGRFDPLGKTAVAAACPAQHSPTPAQPATQSAVRRCPEDICKHLCLGMKTVGRDAKGFTTCLNTDPPVKCICICDTTIEGACGHNEACTDAYKECGLEHETQHYNNPRIVCKPYNPKIKPIGPIGRVVPPDNLGPSDQCKAMVKTYDCLLKRVNRRECGVNCACAILMALGPPNCEKDTLDKQPCPPSEKEECEDAWERVFEAASAKCNEG
jgi:hypothetical protein